MDEVVCGIGGEVDVVATRLVIALFLNGSRKEDALVIEPFILVYLSKSQGNENPRLNNLVNLETT